MRIQLGRRSEVRDKCGAHKLYTTAKEGNVLANLFSVPCLPGDFTVYPAVSEGVFLMIAPLPPGKHVIQFVGLVGPVNNPFVESDLTYDLTVKQDRDCDNR